MIEGVVRRPVAVLMSVAAVLVFGMVSLDRLPTDLMPPLAYPTVTVRTEYPGAAPLEVEDRVTRRVEQTLAVVAGLRRMSSVSRAGVSDVGLEFSWEADLARSAQDVREKLDSALLPEGVGRPRVLRYDPALDPILRVGVAGPDSMDLGRLRRVAEEEVERALEGMDGVAAARVRGGDLEEVRVELDPRALVAHRVDAQTVARRLAEENTNLAGGLVYEGETAFLVRTVNEFRDLGEMEQTPVATRGGTTIRLRDVARVSRGWREREVITRVDGRETVVVDVYKEADANVVTLARRVRERLLGSETSRAMLEAARAIEATDPVAARALRERFGGSVQDRLQDGVRLVLLSDRAVFVERAVAEVGHTALAGGALAVGVLFLFLRRLAPTMVLGASIPISVVATFGAMHLAGVSLNIMSLGGLALGVGMLVDNAIVVLESIARRREEGESPMVAAVRGTQEVAGAVTASTLTTIAVFLPVVFVEGIAERVFADQALTVVCSLSASLAVAIFFIPVCAARLDTGAAGASAAPAAGGLAARAARAPWGALGRQRARREALRRRLGPAVASPLVWATWALTGPQLALEALGRVLAWTVARALRWGARGGSLGVRLVYRLSGPATRLFDAAWLPVQARYPALVRSALARPGTVLGLTGCLAAAAAALAPGLGVELLPEVRQDEILVRVSAPVGTPLVATSGVAAALEGEIVSVEGVGTVTSVVGVDPEDDLGGEEGSHSARIVVRMARGGDAEAVMEAARRAAAGCPSLRDLAFADPVLLSLRPPIEVEVRAHDLDRQRVLADEAARALAGVPVLRDVRTSLQPGNPELRVSFDRDMLARHGLSVDAVAAALRRKVQGETATRYSLVDRKLDVVVRLGERFRASREDVAALVVAGEGGEGTPLRLGDVARIQEGEGPAEVRRVDQRRSALVTAQVRGVDLGGAAQRASAALAGLGGPDEDLVVGGQNREMEQAVRSLALALALSVFLVYAVMASQFESLIHPLIILFTIPLAAIGVVAALAAFGTPVSVVVFLGLITLAGIVVNNAIVLVDCVNRLRARGLGLDEALVEAARLRLRPIAMTTLTTVLGLLPLTGWLPLGGGEGEELRAPMAVTVIAGLSASALLTLVVVPVLYAWVERRRRTGAP